MWVWEYPTLVNDLGITSNSDEIAPETAWPMRCRRGLRSSSIHCTFMGWSMAFAPIGVTAVA